MRKDIMGGSGGVILLPGFMGATLLMEKKEFLYVLEEMGV